MTDRIVIPAVSGMFWLNYFFLFILLITKKAIDSARMYRTSNQYIPLLILVIRELI